MVPNIPTSESRSGLSSDFCMLVPGSVQKLQIHQRERRAKSPRLAPTNDRALSSPQARTSPAPLSSSPMTISFVNRSQVAIGVRSTLPLSALNSRTIWKKDPRMAVYRNLESQGTASGTATSNEGLKQFLRDASKNPALLDLLEFIAF